MPTLLRRPRGLLGIGVATGLAWAIIGAVIVAAGSVVDPASVDPGKGRCGRRGRSDGPGSSPA